MTMPVPDDAWVKASALVDEVRGYTGDHSARVDISRDWSVFSALVACPAGDTWSIMVQLPMPAMDGGDVWLGWLQAECDQILDALNRSHEYGHDPLAALSEGRTVTDL